MGVIEDAIETTTTHNKFVVSIRGKLNEYKGAISRSMKNGKEIQDSVSPIVKEINTKLSSIKDMLDKAKTIKKEYIVANTQLERLGKQREQASKALEDRTNQIKALTDKIKTNEAIHLEDHERLTKEVSDLQLANQRSLDAKKTVDGMLAALKVQSDDATKKQQEALAVAMQEKTAAEETHRKAVQDLANTQAALGNSQQHAKAMQTHMNSLGKLKEQQENLTAALNGLSGEIDAANDDINSLDEAHVSNLNAIKGQLQRLDQELGTIIESEPPSQPPAPPAPPAAGSGNPKEMENRIPRQMSKSLPHVKTDAFGNINFDNDNDNDAYASRPNILWGTTDMPGTNPDENINYLGADRPSSRHVTSADEDALLEEGLKRGPGSDAPPFVRTMPGYNNRRQRGGYIAIKKTRSKSSSSSGRRGTRRKSSSRSSSTRRKRHRGSSSSSTRSSRR